MKKIVLVVLVLGLVMAGASGCTKEETPVQTVAPEAAVKAEVAAPLQVPAPIAIPEAPEKIVNEAVSPMQEFANALENPDTIKSVTSAVQSATQEAILEGSAITDGVTSSVQSDTQDSAREGSAIAGGVTSAAQSSTQGLVREGSAIVGAITGAAQSSSQTTTPAENSTPIEDNIASGNITPETMPDEQDSTT
jgi:hypothetical protein